MAETATDEAATGGGLRRPRDDRYTRVAIILHWAIAALIIYNIISGFLIWDIAEDYVRATPPLYFIGLTTHLSAGLTVLLLTVVRIAWRLMHEPPAFAPDMKPWERHTAHFTHFFLYAAMVLMPLTGWAILSANPAPGSAGAEARAAAMAQSMPEGAPPMGPPGGPPPGAMQPPRIWFVLMPMPAITPIQEIGNEAEGLEPLRVLHDRFAEWHELGGWLVILLLLLHVAGALKHQWIDRHPTLQRMGLGKWPDQDQPH